MKSFSAFYLLLFRLKKPNSYFFVKSWVKNWVVWWLFGVEFLVGYFFYFTDVELKIIDLIGRISFKH